MRDGARPILGGAVLLALGVGALLLAAMVGLNIYRLQVLTP
jgi:hypothetical protein